MNELIDLALDEAQRNGAEYGDIRIVRRETESLTVKNGALEAADSDRTAGFGVRVMVEGAWGFAGSARLERDEVESVTREAVAIARASGLARRERIVLDDTPPAVGSYRTSFVEDPMTVSIDDRLAILFEADAAMGQVRGLSLRQGSIETAREIMRRSGLEMAVLHIVGARPEKLHGCFRGPRNLGCFERVIDSIAALADFSA